MDFAGNVSPESKHLYVCRCCLKEDGSLDTISEYSLNTERKTYEKMLKETFNIQISQFKQETKALMCEKCVARLKDAYTFKLMVAQSEVTFLEYLQNWHSNGDWRKDDAEIRDPILKSEAIKIETIESIHNGCENSNSCDDDETLSDLKLELMKTDGATEQKERKRKHLPEKKCKMKRFKKKHHDIVSNEPPEKDWSKIAERRGKGPLLRDYSLKLIQNSTLCVFQWNKSRYRCFCCKEPFSDIKLLKEHTEKSHTLEDIEKKIIAQQNRLVKVEISNLECKICQRQLEDLTHLKRHLSETHAMDLSEDLLVPFKIENDLKCQICFEHFTVFRLLNIHINKHFQKQVCHICGAGFSNLVFLNLHRTRSHRPFVCKPCNLTFNNKADKKHHDISIHNMKYERKLRFPCPYCTERFFQENLRVKHLVDYHGMSKPDFKCSVCSKSFITKSMCNNHVKNVHNKEKSHECDVCHIFFYSKSDVARHRVTHTGEKKFSCDLCNNLFATRDSLRRHMKRTHVGVH